MTRSAAVAAGVFVLVLGSGAAVATYAAANSASNAQVRGVVLFVGDSNVTLSAGQIVAATTWQMHFNNGYIPVLASRVGASIRSEDCLVAKGCHTDNYWQIRLRALFKRVHPNAIVNNLGINDTAFLGTPTTRGYAAYSAKIDWFMGLLPKGVPVFWTNLPCSIEPRSRLVGCRHVNAALTQATKRWPNLVVINWAAAADAHHEWMTSHGTSPGVHYTITGDSKWTNLVVKTLDAHLRAPS
jgi:lysophospholipase L1-like esterase